MEEIGGTLPLRSIAAFWSALVVLGAACATETAETAVLPTPVGTSPSLGWARQFGSAGADEATGVAVDAIGNVYVAGWAQGSIDGEIGAGSYDSFVRKYDASGTVLWTRQFGSAQEDGASDVDVDADGNVYVVGRTGEEPVVESAGVRWDAYVRKLGPDGSELWSRRFGSADLDWANGVAVDGSGNVYVVGATLGSLPGQTADGRGETFLRKYDAHGVELWTRQFGTGQQSEASGVAVDTIGNVYVTGSTLGTLPGQTSAGGWNSYVRKYDPSGVELWTRQFGSGGGDTAQAVEVDRGGDIYVAGTTRGTLPGQARLGGFVDAFVAKYDAAGTLLWMTQFGSAGFDMSSGATVDVDGSLYVAGRTEKDFPGQTNAGEFDAFVQKYDSSGRLVWTKQFGSGLADYALSVAVGRDGGVYAAGSGFLPGLPLSGDRDAFVVQLLQ